jgi:hypothetical protein
MTEQLREFEGTWTALPLGQRRVTDAHRRRCGRPVRRRRTGWPQRLEPHRRAGPGRPR